MIKACSKCKERLDVSRFPRDATRADGWYPQCKDCRRAGYDAEKRRAAGRRSARKNAHKHKAYQKQWRQENKEHLQARSRAEYLASDKIKLKNRCTEWRNANREKARECCRAWRKNNPDKVKEQYRLRRARKHSVSHEPYTSREILDRDNWICGICRKAIDKIFSYPHPMSASIDHIIPISRGGPDLKENLQAAHFLCNNRKNTATQIIA